MDAEVGHREAMDPSAGVPWKLQHGPGTSTWTVGNTIRRPMDARTVPSRRDTAIHDTDGRAKGARQKMQQTKQRPSCSFATSGLACYGGIPSAMVEAPRGQDPIRGASDTGDMCMEMRTNGREGKTQGLDREERGDVRPCLPFARPDRWTSRSAKVDQDTTTEEEWTKRRNRNAGGRQDLFLRCDF